MATNELLDIVSSLTKSYSLQNDLYRQLTDLVQKILGQMALSRGDVTGVMNLFENKQKLLNRISVEREKSSKNIEIWQTKKNSILPNEETKKLDSVLEETEKSISAFLQGEDQLKTYLEHLTGR